MPNERCSSKPTDMWPVEMRASLLGQEILPAIWSTTGRLFSLSHLYEAESILDVACGRGGFGVAARNIGVTAQIVGIDAYNYTSNPETPTGYNEYSSVVVGSVINKKTLDAVRHVDYDLVFAMCTYPEVFSFLAKSRKTLPIKPGGRIVLVSEQFMTGNEFQDFHLLIGERYGYQIGVWEK